MGWFSKKKKQVPQQGLPSIPRFQERPPAPHEFPRYERGTAQEEGKGPHFPELHKDVKYTPEGPEKFPEAAEEKTVEEQPFERPMEEPFQQRETKLMDRTLPKEERPPLNIPMREPSFLRPKHYPERETFARLSDDRESSADPAATALEEQRKTVHKDEEHLPVRPPVTKEGIPEGMEQSVSADKPIFVKLGQYREAMSTIKLLKQKLQDAEALLQKFEELRNKEQAELDTAKKHLHSVKEKLLSIDKHLFEA